MVSIWLAVKGEWLLVGVGIAAIFLLPFLISIAMMPGMGMGLLGSTKKNPIRYVFFAATFFWNAAIITALTAIVFLDIVRLANGNLVPYALWGWLGLIQDEFGSLSIRQFDRPKIRVDIRRWRNRWKDRPRAADTGKQVLSRVLSYVVAEGGLATNPCEGLPNLYQNNRADVIWDADSLDRLCKHASIEVANAARLAALTGLRQADLLKLAWSHIGTNAIEISTGKSRGKRTAIIPLTRDLKQLLKALPRRSTAVLTNSEGKPWRGFSSSWNKTMKESGLSETGLHFHDLRGTAATNFFRAGFTTREIAQTLAWSEEKVDRLIDRYVKRDEILKDRIRRMDRAQRQR